MRNSLLRLLFGKPSPDTRFWYYAIYTALIIYAVTFFVVDPAQGNGGYVGAFWVVLLVSFFLNPFQEIDDP